MIQITKCRKYQNNYKYEYCRLTLNEKVVDKFFKGEDKDKKVIDVVVDYDAEKDALIIKKLKLDEE